MSFDPAAYKQAVKEEWGRAAQGWHRWIPAINAWLDVATETMLDQADVIDGGRVIDIAAGDGGQSVSAAGRVGSSGEVLATDIAPEFVKLANAVASRLNLKQLRAEVMDAESLTLPDDQFDAAISRLGLMYLPNLRMGLSEIKRVLCTGGRISAVVFTTAEKTPFFSIPIRLIREKRGLPSPEPGQPGPFSLGLPGVLAGHLEAAGFQNVRETVLEAPLRFASAKECVQWRREASGTMQQLLNGLDDEAKEKIWDEVEDAMSQFETPTGVCTCRCAASCARQQLGATLANHQSARCLSLLFCKLLARLPYVQSNLSKSQFASPVVRQVSIVFTTERFCGGAY